MVYSCFLLSLLFFTKIFVLLHAAKTIGPVGNIILNSIMECKEKPSGDEIQTLHAEAKSIDDKGNKALFLDIVLKAPIDSKVEHNIEILKWEGGGWKKFYNVKGNFCRDVQKLFGKIFEKFRLAIKPPIPEPCPIKPGSYSLKNFQASSKDMTIPAIFYGKLQLILTLFKNKKVIFCIQGEGDSQAPT